MKLAFVTLAASFALAGAAAAQTPAVSAPPAPAQAGAHAHAHHGDHAADATVTAAAAAAPAVAAPTIAATPEAQALAALISGLQIGKVDYSKLDERIGGAMKPQEAALAGLIKGKGALTSIEAKGPGANGVQNLTAKFATDSTDFGVGLDAQGRIAGFTVTD
jgi:hypothetical protein